MHTRLTFHPDPTARTVMPVFAGQPRPDHLTKHLEPLRAKPQSPDGLADQMVEMLSQQEVSALLKRRQAILRDPVLPALDPYRNVPWPWV